MVTSLAIQRLFQSNNNVELLKKCGKRLHISGGRHREVAQGVNACLADTFSMPGSIP
jgi:hypothetical protein